MSRHDRYLDMLEAMASAMDPVNGYRVVACVVIQNKLVSVGQCRYKTHPLQAKYSKNDDAIFLHAEIDAIKNALRNHSISDLTKADMYVLRLRKVSTNDHTFIRASAKPCRGCSMAVKAYELRNVYYTNDEGNMVKL